MTPNVVIVWFGSVPNQNLIIIPRNYPTTLMERAFTVFVNGKGWEEKAKLDQVWGYNESQMCNARNFITEWEEGT